MNYYRKINECLEPIASVKADTEIQKAYKRIKGFNLCIRTKVVLCSLIVRRHYSNPAVVIGKVQDTCNYGNRDELSYLKNIGQFLDGLSEKQFNSILFLIEHMLNSERKTSTVYRALRVIFRGDYKNITEKSLKSITSEDSTVVEIVAKLPELAKFSCPNCGKRVEISEFNTSRVCCKDCFDNHRTKRNLKKEEDSKLVESLHKLKLTEPVTSCSDKVLEFEEYVKSFISELTDKNDLVHMYLTLKQEVEKLGGIING